MTGKAGRAAIGNGLKLAHLKQPNQLKSVKLLQEHDPFTKAFAIFNNEVALSGAEPILTRTPNSDQRAYDVENRRKRYCRPELAVAQRMGWEQGPDVRFVREEDGSLRLTVAFEEDATADHREDGALPFEVKVLSVAIGPERGGSRWDTVRLDETLLQIPLGDGSDGPAFRIEAAARFDNEDEAARLATAMRTGNARWEVVMEFDWRMKPRERETGSSRGSGGGNGRRSGPTINLRNPGVAPTLMMAPKVMVQPTQLHVARSTKPQVLSTVKRAKRKDSGNRTKSKSNRAAARSAAPTIAVRNFAKMDFNPVIKTILGNQRGRPPVNTRPQPDARTQKVTRRLDAHYSPDLRPYKPIYAALEGQDSTLGWRASAHGQFRPSDVRDTCYILPDRMLLSRDSESTLPNVTGILLEPKELPPGMALQDALITRLTFHVVPFVDPERLVELRKLIRAETSNQVIYSDLAIGGYSKATFLPDPSLSGLGDFMAGTAEATSQEVTPETGMTLVYEGRAEFTALLFEKLRGDGIRGEVAFELPQDGGGDLLTVKVPVVLSINQLAPLDPTWSFALADPSDPGSERVLSLSNPYDRELKASGLRVTALTRSSVTGATQEFQHAELSRTELTLRPETSETVALDFGSDDVAWNEYEVVFGDFALETDPQRLVKRLFDTFVNTVRAWRVNIAAVQLQHFDALPDAFKRQLEFIIKFEVEIRRAGGTRVASASLDRENPTATVFLDQSLADMLGETRDAVYEMRRRTVHLLTGVSDWTEWTRGTDANINVFAEVETESS